MYSHHFRNVSKSTQIFFIFFIFLTALRKDKMVMHYSAYHQQTANCGCSLFLIWYIYRCKIQILLFIHKSEGTEPSSHYVSDLLCSVSVLNFGFYHWQGLRIAHYINQSRFRATQHTNMDAWSVVLLVCIDVFYSTPAGGIF